MCLFLLFMKTKLRIGYNEHVSRDGQVLCVDSNYATTQLVFAVLVEATTVIHQRMHRTSQVGIGLQGLASDPQTVDETIGFRLSLTLSDFSLSSLFTHIRGA